MSRPEKFCESPNEDDLLRLTDLVVTDSDLPRTVSTSQRANDVLQYEETDFGRFLANLQSAEPEVNADAESLLNSLKKDHLESLCETHGHHLVLYKDVDIRKGCALLIHRLLTPTEEQPCPSIPKTSKVRLVKDLITALPEMKSNKIARTICEMLLIFAQQLSPGDSSPEVDTALPLAFCSSLDTASPSRLRVAASRAWINIAVFIGVHPSTYVQFQRVVMETEKSFFEILRKQKYNYAQCIIEDMILLAVNMSNLLKDTGRLKHIAASVLKVVDDESLKYSIRFLGLEFIIKAAENGGLLDLEPEFICSLVSVSVKMLVICLEQELANTVETTYTLQRMAVTFNEEIIANQVLYLFPEYLSSESWPKRCAVVTALAQITPACSKALEKTTEFFLPSVVSLIFDPHFRVCLAAINAMEGFSKHLMTEWQVRYNGILPKLIAAMDDSGSPLVQARAFSAALFMSHSCSPDMLTPLLNELVNNLLKFLKKHRQTSKIRDLVSCALEVSLEFEGLVLQQPLRSAVSDIRLMMNNSGDEAYNTAVATLGRVCIYHYNSVDLSKVVLTWLNHLPVKHDLNEAKELHEQLCKMVESSNYESFAADTAYVLRIVAIFAEVLLAGYNLAKPTTCSNMIRLLKRFKKKVAPVTWAAIIASLQTPQRKLLARYDL